MEWREEIIGKHIRAVCDECLFPLRFSVPSSDLFSNSSFVVLFEGKYSIPVGLPVVLVVKNLLPKAGDLRDVSLTPGSGRSPGGGHRNPIFFSCLGNPMDRRAWRAIVHGVAKSQT